MPNGYAGEASSAGIDAAGFAAAVPLRMANGGSAASSDMQQRPPRLDELFIELSRTVALQIEAYKEQIRSLSLEQLGQGPQCAACLQLHARGSCSNSSSNTSSTAVSRGQGMQPWQPAHGGDFGRSANLSPAVPKPLQDWPEDEAGDGLSTAGEVRPPRQAAVYEVVAPVVALPPSLPLMSTQPCFGVGQDQDGHGSRLVANGQLMNSEHRPLRPDMAPSVAAHPAPGDDDLDVVYEDQIFQQVHFTEASDRAVSKANGHRTSGKETSRPAAQGSAALEEYSCAEGADTHVRFNEAEEEKVLVIPRGERDSSRSSSAGMPAVRDSSVSRCTSLSRDAMDSRNHLGSTPSLLRGEEPPLVETNTLDFVSGIVIGINAVILGISADNIHLEDIWTKLEYVFTAFFLFEMFYKMYVHGLKRYFFGPDMHWNNFDFAVVLLAIFDMVFTSVLASIGISPGIIKLARLGRLARLVRLLRFKIFHELKMMIQGVIAGLRVLVWAVVLLFFFIYLIGVMTRTTIGTSTVHHFAITQSFETVPMAMFTLFRCFTDGCSAYDGSPLTVHLYRYYSAPFMILYILIFLFVTIGIFNLIMAIFIDNVMAASVQRKQKERGVNAIVMEARLRELVMKLAKQTSIQEDEEDEFDEDELVITREAFDQWLQEKDLLNMLDELDIGTSNKSELFEVIDCDLSGELEVPEIISGLMKLRGPSDKSDAVAALLGIRYMTKMLEAVHNKIIDLEEYEKDQGLQWRANTVFAVDHGEQHDASEAKEKASAESRAASHEGVSQTGCSDNGLTHSEAQAEDKNRQRMSQYKLRASRVGAGTPAAQDPGARANLRTSRASFGMLMGAIPIGKK
eukprot:TRINITY_DN6421_c1_g1_i1.p1 TRINITY_DN6421_c1_g1~~TRINITY_DN6421_c1_g1_i1.p1  ORF type:complete len:851 (-),score=202.27 TRINITY_DN6421_c1_g1_i1:222-2774(-)